MEKSEILKDDDRDEENERNEHGEREEDDKDRPVKTKLPGMVIPYLESNKGVMEMRY